MLRQSLRHEFDMRLILDLERKHALRRSAVFERGGHRRGAGSVGLDLIGAVNSSLLTFKSLSSRQISAPIKRDFTGAHFRTAGKLDVRLDGRGDSIFAGDTLVGIGRSAMSRASRKARE